MLASEIKVLSDSESERVHGAALDVLERAGVRVGEEALREQMKARGASVGEGDCVSIPRELVTECLGTLNRTPVLQCVNGKTLRHGAADRYYQSCVTDPYILDYRDGIRRPRLDDIARHARLGDALPLVDQIHLMDATIPGLDGPTSVLRALEAFVANTTTGYHCAPGSLRDTRYWIEIAEIMAGGSLKKNPILGAYVPAVSPLSLTDQNMKQLRMFLEAGVLCVVGPCAIAGATAPYTQAGRPREQYDAALARIVQAFNVEWVVMAGWLHIWTGVFLQHFPSRVVNLHPALPGMFPGMQGIEEAYAAYQRGEIEHTGVMVHLVPDPAVDAGPLLAQEVVPIHPDDSLDDLETRIHTVEHRLLVDTLRGLLGSGGDRNP